MLRKTGGKLHKTTAGNGLYMGAPKQKASEREAKSFGAGSKGLCNKQPIQREHREDGERNAEVTPDTTTH
ncbi:hypothetical protein B5F34_00625 [Mediterranea sp. An20]|nr:hypothetical protein B5F34_00625 [Mediterranea sp. An20]